MSLPLLTTKFHIPPARPEMVARPRLLAKLLAGIERPQSFTLLSGPAGSGKTTLLSQFTGEVDCQVAWLSLDEGDNDASRFWTYLISAVQSALPEVGESALALLETTQPLPAETVPTLLINDIAGQNRQLLVLLDDYHLIQTSSIHDSLVFLLDHLPHNLHLLVATRIDPPWPLHRYRARNQIIELRAADLRFNREETAHFLNHTMGLQIAPEHVATLAGRTEGWAAGLQLAALALQTPGQGDTASFVEAFAGSHLYVAEYLVEEVLKRQTLPMQTFLLQTSILERLSAPLCEALTQQQAAQATLVRLDRANLFVIPLDNEGRWFRYHHLFADLLQARLRQSQPEEVVALLHGRAAAWYEQNGFEADAVRHALSAGDFERAAAIVDRAGQTLIFTDQYQLLQRWLDALPPASFQTHPRLEIYRVLLDLTKGTLDMTEQTLREKEGLVNALPSSPENDRLRVEAKVYLALFLAFQNTARSIQIAREALDIIPETNLKRRAFLFSALYRAYGMDGDYEKGREAYVECLRLAREAGHYGMAANTTMIRTFDLCQYGKLDEAAHYCRLIIQDGSRLRQKVFFPAGPVYIGLGGIYLERNQLDEAEEYLEQGVELARQGGLYGLFTAFTQKARLLQAKGALDQALAELELLEQTLQRREFTLMARHVSLQLARGDRAAAAQLEIDVLTTLSDSAYARRLPLVAVEAFKLSLARLLLARGELGQAGVLLDEIQATVEPGRRFGRLLEVHLLRALLLQKEQSDPVAEEALSSLEKALDLAEPAGFVLLFLEEGPALVPLLHAVVSRDRASKQYASKLLEACGSLPAAPPMPSHAAASLLEPLTPREMEVLLLIAAGHSNRSIAEKLFITVRTVKKHASNIYGKLHVSRRTEAVARARELGLLSTDR